MEVFLIWVICSLGCAILASSKDRTVFGHAMGGLFLGPLWLIVCAGLPRVEKPSSRQEPLLTKEEAQALREIW